MFLPPNRGPDPELQAKYGRHPSLKERSQGVLVALAVVIGLLVIASIIGALL